MTHLVTGGSGFLGNLIARRLAARGERVRVLDVWEDPSRPPEVGFVRVDIRDRDGVAAAMRGVNVVHHNVAMVPLTKAGRAFWEVNVEGSRVAAEEAARAGVRTFVHMSSSAIFGAPSRCPITEQTAPSPVEVYGRAKLAGEVAVRETCGREGLRLVVVRPRTILGEGRFGIFQVLFEWIRDGRDVYVIGKGEHLFQFVHAHDLMDAYMLAVDARDAMALNVGTDRFGTLREALENLIRRAGSKSRVRSLPVGPSIAALRALDLLRLCPLAPWHYLTYHKPFHFDVAPLLAMGWRPRYSNDELLWESYESFLRGGHRPEGAASPHRRPVKQGILGLLKRFS